MRWGVFRILDRDRGEGVMGWMRDGRVSQRKKMRVAIGVGGMEQK